MGTLRLILALSVVISHSSAILGVKLVDAPIAVQSFYIISGFYMALILNEKYIGVNNSYKLFITNRFLRLYPIYWAVLFCAISFSIFQFFYSGSGYFNRYVEYFSSMNLVSFIFLNITNLFLFFQDIVMFLGLDTSTGNLFFASNFRETTPLLYEFLFVPQAWTIGIELMFYIIAPYLVKRKTKHIIGLIACSIILRLILIFGFDLKNDPWTYRFFPTEIIFFLLGIIAYRIYIKTNKTVHNSTLLYSIWIFLLFLTFFFGFLPMSDIKNYSFLFLLFLSLPFIFFLTKNWKLDRYIGELSYPIYISHAFILSCIRSLKIPAKYGIGLILIIFTILFSILLIEFVTKRIEKIRQRRIKII